MNLSYVQKLLIAADPFSATRTNFRAWRTNRKAKRRTPEPGRLPHERHLTVEQRKDISTELQYSTTGPVSITAAASDREAVSYEGEIANLLEDMGFPVEIDNAKRKPPAQQLPCGR